MLLLDTYQPLRVDFSYFPAPEALHCIVLLSKKFAIARSLTASFSCCGT